MLKALRLFGIEKGVLGTFNLRKNRKGAFREDRYHATAVQTDEHLAKCLVYIDRNMVRAGVVRHPAEILFLTGIKWLHLKTDVGYIFVFETSTRLAGA